MSQLWTTLIDGTHLALSANNDYLKLSMLKCVPKHKAGFALRCANEQTLDFLRIGY